MEYAIPLCYLLSGQLLAWLMPYYLDDWQYWALAIGNTALMGAVDVMSYSQGLRRGL